MTALPRLRTTTSVVLNRIAFGSRTAWLPPDQKTLAIDSSDIYTGVYTTSLPERARRASTLAARNREQERHRDDQQRTGPLSGAGGTTRGRGRHPVRIHAVRRARWIV